jgi:hypothetical protein
MGIMNTTVTYHVDILGKLWLPSCDAAQSVTYNRSDLERAGWLPSVADNDEQAEMIEDYVNTHEGDFSAIVGLRIVRQVKNTFRTEKDGTVGLTEKSVFVTLRDFSDDEENRYLDCFATDED